jgi:hypothetical protein
VAVSGNSVYVVGGSDTFGAFIYRFNASNGDTWSKKQLSADTPDITVDGSGSIYVVGTVSIPAITQSLVLPASACGTTH